MWLTYALLSAFFAALTAILAKVGVKDVPSNLATAIRTVVILILAWVIVWARGEYSSIDKLPRTTLVFLVLSGITTALSWIFYFRALQIGQASNVSAIDKSSLALTVVLAAIFLREPLSWKGVAGVVLIIIGMFLVASGTSKG